MSEGVTDGAGYSVGHIDQMGERYGFRKIRRALGVGAFGVNALVLPPGYETGRHYHDQQQELYFVHRGTVEIEFGDGSAHTLLPGAAARVDAATVRRIRNVGDEDAVYLVVGGKDGYVGRDGQLVDEADADRRRAFGAGGGGSA